MHTKIIDPKIHGSKVYDNTGSAQRTINYLAHEAKENERAVVFFGADSGATYTGADVVALIDGNHKGLGRDAAKFYSVVLSPSAEQTALLGNDPQQLRQYTRQVMELYAKNFKLPGGRELSEKDLVWAAMIHQDRKYKGTDDREQGEFKRGHQTHIHVIVSARDAAHRTTLNPLGKAERFNRVQFHAQTNVRLAEHIGYAELLMPGQRLPTTAERVAEKAADITARAAANKQKQLTPAQEAARADRVAKQVVRLNSQLAPTQQLDATRVQAAAAQRDYDQRFFSNLGYLLRNATKGVYTPEPYAYLVDGKVKKVSAILVPERSEPAAVMPPPASAPAQAASATLRALAQSVRQFSQQIDPKTRTQDVRSEAEKDQEYER